MTPTAFRWMDVYDGGRKVGVTLEWAWPICFWNIDRYWKDQ